MAGLGDNFYPRLVQMAREVGMAPEDLLAVMVSESGIDPTAHEKKHGASGLIQFMPKTLKGLDYKGTPEQFRNMAGEQQLDWIKKYVVNQMKLNGGPFKSAAQYYIANFFPAALKLPGIRSGNPSTPFVEQNPAIVTVNGKQYSKKYYDAGIKISPSSEKSAYAANPLFHGKTQGAITYQDMLNQIEKNKRNPKYTRALAAMTQKTNYAPSNTLPDPRYVAQNKSIQPAIKPAPLAPINIEYTNVLDKFVNMVAAQEKIKLQKIANKLNHSKFMIRLSSNELNNSIEFARILSMAVKEELQAHSEIYYDDDNVDIIIKVPGESAICFEALNQLNAALVDTFKIATKKIGGINIKTDIYVNSNSNLNPLSSKVATSNYRKFILKFVGK